MIGLITSETSTRGEYGDRTKGKQQEQQHQTTTQVEVKMQDKKESCAPVRKGLEGAAEQGFGLAWLEIHTKQPFRRQYCRVLGLRPTFPKPA
jgi:hypothetical protein